MNRKQFLSTLFSPILAAFGYKRKPKFIQLTPIRVKSALTFNEFVGALDNKYKIYWDGYGVSPMSPPSKEIFAMKTKYKGNTEDIGFNHVPFIPTNTSK